MTLKLIHGLGWFLARCPEAVPRGLTTGLGRLLFALPTRRRRAVLANLHHAFPELSETERRHLARLSCERAVEMALFVLVSPHLDREHLRGRFSLDPHFARELRANAETPEPVVAVVPHLCLMESLTLLPVLADGPAPRIATIYRPLKQKAVEDWVLRTRERFGMRLLSRKEGFAEAIEMLRERGVVAVLFDQNAGGIGTLSTFLGRVASSTELPGLLASRFNARFVAVWTERTGFWRGTLRMEDLPRPAEVNPAIFTANDWLERRLESDASFRENWLWLHDRWRTQDQPERRFQLKQRRDALAEECLWRGWEELPRRTRLWIRMPNWLGDVVMALPLIRALRRGRPDLEITLLARGHLAVLLESWSGADRVIALPAKKADGQTNFFGALAGEYPDTHLLFTNSFRGDREAKLIGAPQRFGIRRPGKPRPLLTHVWELPAGFNEAYVHQSELWRQFLDHFGLREKPDTTPLTPAELGLPAPVRTASGIGLICGTENEPSKRWPVQRWRELIERFPGEHFTLFGTARDRAITDQVAAGFPAGHVVNRAGETDLRAYAAELATCRVLVTNDTGGMHLANALGVPVVVIFGPTNPVRTGPVFDAPKTLLHPPGCPPTGGADITGVTAEAAALALRAHLQGAPS